MKPFFIKIPNFWAWADNINRYFYQKLSLHTQIPNIHLGLGFEFEPQRISGLAIVCP
jgi:hypothetical protein